MTEAQIQTKIAKRLKENGWLVIKLIQTSMNGIPDLMCIRKGNVVFLEVKKPDTQPSELQKYVIDGLTKSGVYAAVVRSVEDVDTLCYKWI